MGKTLIMLNNNHRLKTNDLLGLIIQHYVLKQVFKNNIHVHLVEPTKILESACGVGKYSCIREDSGTQINKISTLGLWSLEIAHDFPNCQVIGIDVVPPSEKEGWNLATVSSFNTSSSLSAGQLKKETNVKFQYGDILQTLMFPIITLIWCISEM